MSLRDNNRNSTEERENLLLSLKQDQDQISPRNKFCLISRYVDTSTNTIKVFLLLAMRLILFLYQERLAKYAVPPAKMRNMFRNTPIQFLSHCHDPLDTHRQFLWGFLHFWLTNSNSSLCLVVMSVVRKLLHNTLVSLL